MRETKNVEITSPEPQIKAARKRSGHRATKQTRKERLYEKRRELAPALTLAHRIARSAEIASNTLTRMFIAQRNLIANRGARKVPQEYSEQKWVDAANTNACQPVSPATALSGKFR